MTDPFSEKKFWVLDGGLGTALKKNGFDLKHPLWSAKVLSEDPKAILAAHEEFLAAGAEIILSSAYQASLAGFIQHLGLYQREAEALMIFTNEIACRARDEYLLRNPGRRVLVGASIGPFGAILGGGREYSGDYEITECDAGEYYEYKIETLSLPRKNSKVDFLAFETIPLANEAEMILAKLAKVPFMPAWISFSRADELKKALPKLNSNSQIVAVGLNCVAIEGLEKVLLDLRKATSKRIVIYPNKGNSPQDWQALTRLWAASGASIIGGCCGVESDTIRSIAEGLSGVGSN